jgi:general secretion pathway protein L
MTLPVDHIHNLDSYVTNEGEAFESVAGADVVKMDLWVPSEAVTVHSLDVPTAPKRKWPELIPWMLEDRLLQSVEGVHFVVADQVVDDQLQILVASQSDIQEWQRVAQNSGVLPRAMYPDFLALPWEEGRITVGWRDGLCVVRLGVAQGFAASPEMTWAMLDGLLDQQGDAPPRLSISIPQPGIIPQRISELADINDNPIDWQFSQLPAQFNLLTGNFKTQASSGGWLQWLPTALLAVLSAVLSAVYIQIASATVSEQISSLETQLTQGYSTLFQGRRPEPDTVRAETEKQLQLLFAQRRGLDSAPVAALIALDKLMVGCGCQLSSLQTTDNGLLMQIANGAALKERVPNIPGYQVAITQQAGTDERAIELRLTANKKRAGR